MVLDRRQRHPSKYTFGIVMLLFSIADTGVKGAAPVVTIPANQ